MKKSIALLSFTILTVLIYSSAFGQIKTESFEFVHNGKKLSGLLDLPTEQKPISIILIIQGYGKSNIVEGNWYYDLRSNFVKLGIVCIIWDKHGCGKSEGNFDIAPNVSPSPTTIKFVVERYCKHKN